jgi:hypothetical protein
MAARAQPLALTGFLPAWDVERRRADLTPIIAWALDRIWHLGHPVDSLGALHHQLDAERARAEAQELTAKSLANELRRHVRRAILEAVPEIPRARVSIQTHTHFRILVPHDAIAAVPAHIGFRCVADIRGAWQNGPDSD